MAAYLSLLKIVMLIFLQTAPLQWMEDQGEINMVSKEGLNVKITFTIQPQEDMNTYAFTGLIGITENDKFQILDGPVMIRMHRQGEKLFLDQLTEKSGGKVNTLVKIPAGGILLAKENQPEMQKKLYLFEPEMESIALADSIPDPDDEPSYKNLYKQGTDFIAVHVLALVSNRIDWIEIGERDEAFHLEISINYPE